jgi:hypothetical protein
MTLVIRHITQAYVHYFTLFYFILCLIYFTVVICVKFSLLEVTVLGSPPSSSCRHASNILE